MSFTGNPQLTASQQTLANDGFWPVLTVADLLNDYRIPAEYANNTVIHGVKTAMADVNGDLLPAKEALLLTPHADFETYLTTLTDNMNGETRLGWHYQNAVFCNAKAFLLQQFNSMNRREDAKEAAKESPETYEFWMRESSKSIKAIFNAVLPDVEFFESPGFYVSMI